MLENSNSFPFGEYLNPVYPHSFPDPFVFKFRGEYFAYCTDFWRDGRVFGVLRSRDLINWTEIGGAMEKLANDAPFYWAPEVTYANGRFYLYYSVGNEALMELRVAVSDRPDGGFIDAGRKLSTEDFAIDGHVFTDTDAQRYFFYATDFTTHSHIGTGTVVDKMIDLYTLEGAPRPVTRAKYDWQVYDQQRKEKGGVRWHTVEGAFVLKRKGIYYEMFSGGNWQTVSYGVSFAVTDDIARDAEWAQFSDGENVLPILRTIPGRIVGPGHNSVVRGPDNRELFCVYHRWTEDGRVLAIDRMDFAGTRIFIDGASDTPQPAPFKPTVVDYFDDGSPNSYRNVAGAWTFSGSEAISAIAGENRLTFNSRIESFLAEFYLRGTDSAAENSSFGFSLGNDSEENLLFKIFPFAKRVVVAYGESEEGFDVPNDYEAAVFHLVRVEVDGLFVRLTVGDSDFRFEKLLAKSSNRIALISRDMRAGFSAFSLTTGFEDLFEREDPEILQRGWKKLTEAGLCFVDNQELYFSNNGDEDAILAKTATVENFELTVNVRLAATESEPAGFGFVLLDESDDEVCRFSFEGSPGKYFLSAGKDRQKFCLPAGFAPENYHQFRFLKAGGTVLLRLEDLQLGAVSLYENRCKIGIFCRNSTVAFDMIRLTVL